MKKKVSKKVGRPSKYDKIDLMQVVVAGELGLTDKELCKFFVISKATLTKYKNQYPEFIASLKKGKDIADEKVVRALYKRATGYSHPDIHITSYQGEVTTTSIIKHYPPDTTACIYWLRNRQGWIDKLPMDIIPDIPFDAAFESWSDEKLDKYVNNK